VTFFEGTPHATRTCPRRLIRQHPDVHAVFDVWGACDGRVGVDGLARISTHAAEAFDVVASARAARAKADAEAAQKEAARGGR
jgi:hypothetical protein